jgi:UrcA family protein
MSRTALACLSAIALCAAAPAFAQQSTDQVNSRVVGYGDLNLDSNRGADTVIRRVESATNYVCGDRTGPRSMQETSSVHACQSQTADNAIADIDHPNVNSRYYGYTPQVDIGPDESYNDAPAYPAYPSKGKGQ